jgi:putative ATP-binding cassette transporter
MNFRQALLDLDEVEAAAGLIERNEDPEGRLTLDAVRVETRYGCVSLEPPRLEVRPGERVLILGKPGSGRTSFFLAIAGLWSAGSGHIGVPPDREVAYLTQRPFVPRGPLREALISGSKPSRDDELRASLRRVGLDSLADSLDADARWDRDLPLGEQERLGYARVLLARPKWLICDEALDPLDEASRRVLLSILADELADTALINISQRREPPVFYGKEAKLVTSPCRGAPPKPGSLRREGSRPKRVQVGIGS